MERFFGNIGGKLKKFAFVIAIIGIVASLICGIVFFCTSSYSISANIFGMGSRTYAGYYFYELWERILIFLIFTVSGSVASYMGSWMLYAFGTLVENTQRIADKLTGTSTAVPSAADSTESAAPLYTWKCSSCGAENPAHKGLCSKCGTTKPAAR